MGTERFDDEQGWNGSGLPPVFSEDHQGSGHSTTIQWRWLAVGLRGRRYQLSDSAGGEMGTVLITNVTGSLKRVSTESGEYSCARRPFTPFIVNVRDTATSATVARVDYGRASTIEVQGSRPLHATIDQRARALTLVTSRGETLVRAEFGHPYLERSLHKPYPSGQATLEAIDKTNDGVLITALAFFLVMTNLRPSE